MSFGGGPSDQTPDTARYLPHSHLLRTPCPTPRFPSEGPTSSSGPHPLRRIGGFRGQGSRPVLRRTGSRRPPTAPSFDLAPNVGPVGLPFSLVGEDGLWGEDTPRVSTNSGATTDPWSRSASRQCRPRSDDPLSPTHRTPWNLVKRSESGSECP